MKQKTKNEESRKMSAEIRLAIIGGVITFIYMFMVDFIHAARLTLEKLLISFSKKISKKIRITVILSCMTNLGRGRYHLVDGLRLPLDDTRFQLDEHTVRCGEFTGEKRSMFSNIFLRFCVLVTQSSELLGFTAMNPYFLIAFCTQLRHLFFKMITFGKVDLAKKATTRVNPTSNATKK